MIPMFLINLPPTTAGLLKKFFQIASFDLIPVTWLWEQMFYMPPSQELELRFSQVGFEDSNFIGVVGSLFLSVLAACLLLLFA